MLHCLTCSGAASSALDAAHTAAGGAAVAEEVVRAAARGGQAAAAVRALRVGAPGGGIRCRRRNTDRFWDIRFDKGVLHIPRILIHDGTKALFLNLIAFEQCHMDIATPGGNNITSYAIFMDNLINSAEDVKYLHDRGIIEHWLGSDGEVAELFNRLCLEVVFDINDSYLSGLSDQVNRYYDHKWSTWVASLQHNYFTNPWAIVSVVAGVFLLLLTMMQTFYSAYSYYRPPA
ncbi:hypothetical protein ZWY2020_055699 [Hordeum vulgare]|nr:hypothetical protein ZWY2020_055699 [Hordeum vulgare]